MFSKKTDTKLIKLLVFATLVGLGSAIVGTFFAITHFLPTTFFLASSAFDALEKVTTQRLSGARAVFAPEVDTFVDEVAPSLVQIYKQKKPENLELADSLAGDIPSINQIYTSRDLLGSGFVLTSDGWIITHKDVFGQLAKSSLVAASGKNLSPVIDIVIDKWTDIAFLKIAASNLPVVKLGESRELKVGETVFLGAGDSFVFTAISNNNYLAAQGVEDLIFSSEKFNKLFLLKESFGKEFLGSPVANRYGEVVGLLSNPPLLGQQGGPSVSGQREAQKMQAIIPVHHFRSAMGDVLKNQTILRPYLGIHYLELSKTVGVNNILPFLQSRRGALIYGNEARTAVVPKSPADEAGLKKGDIIISVDDEEVGKAKNLPEIISEFKAKDVVDFRVLRNGEEKIVHVELK